MQQQVTRVIVLMRHAQAQDAAPTDAERRLTARGRREAQGAGRWLADRGTVVDHALVSAAVRARDTWEALAEAAGWDLAPDLNGGLYAAGPESVLDLMRAAPDEARCLLVLGHNPTVALLAGLLDDGEGEVQGGDQLSWGYPPAAMTLLEHHGPWGELTAGSARVLAVHVPSSS